MTDTTATAPRPVSASITGQNVSVLINKKFRTFPIGSEQGIKLVEALKESPQDVDKICEIADIANYLASKSFGRVIVDDRDQLRLDGRVINYGLAGKLQYFIAEGYDVAPLVAFIERVDMNPNKGIAEDLYAFLTKGNLPITPEGYFHAWKNVRDDFMDHHSGTVSYKPGETPSMPREQCDENRYQTCSRGLHACSYSYLPTFHGGRGKTVLVLIDPQDVTAIPTDYNQAKLRCCKMVVIDQVEYEKVEGHLSKGVEDRFTQPVPLEPEIVKDEAYWAEQGAEAGKEAGEDDRGDEYAPSFDIPELIAGGPAEYQLAYTNAFTNAYHTAFHHKPTPAEAFAKGVEDGENGNPTDIEDFDWSDGDEFDEFEGDYAYILGYATGFMKDRKLDEYASGTAVAHGSEDAAKKVEAISEAGDVDINPEDGARWNVVPSAQEDAYRFGFINRYVADALVKFPIELPAVDDDDNNPDQEA